MQDAFAEWQNPLTFKVVTKSIVSFQSVETSKIRPFQGILYPQSSRQRSHKPEGQRAWRWSNLITSFALNVNDIVIDKNNVKYRVDQKNEYSQAGFSEYEITQDWV